MNGDGWPDVLLTDSYNDLSVFLADPAAPSFDPGGLVAVPGTLDLFEVGALAAADADDPDRVTRQQLRRTDIVANDAILDANACPS